MILKNRRGFLSMLGLGLAAVPALLLDRNSGRRTRWEMLTHNEEPEAARFRPDPQSWDNSTVTAAWLGHATVLINFYGTWILTDPVFSERIGLNVANLFTIGPRRLVLPALAFDELPPIDIILVSHAHMDHLDTPSIRRFDRKIPIVMAKNTVDIIDDLGFEAMYEMDWGDWTQIGDVRIEALEVKHFGWRFPWEQDRSRGNPEGRSYNAYLLSKNGRHIVFGGDTAYQEYFKRLQTRSLQIDLAIMPIGAYDPWIHNHANPEQALEMTDHMGCHHLLPIHWNTFIQSEEPTAEPMERLKNAAAPDRIVLDSIGQTWAMAQPAAVEPQPAPSTSTGAE